MIESPIKTIKADISLTDSAITRIKELMEDDPENNVCFRMSVQGGGCVGFQYGFTFEKEPDANDLVIEQSGVQLLVDGQSLMLINGSTLDFITSIAGSMFSVDNPNATNACGCGSSFSC